MGLSAAWRAARAAPLRFASSPAEALHHLP